MGGKPSCDFPARLPFCILYHFRVYTNHEKEPITFYSALHKRLFEECCSNHYQYHSTLEAEELSVFYLLSLVEEVQKNTVVSSYDFKHRVIKPQSLEEPWQTSSTLKAIRLAFNLWNGYVQDDKERFSTPYEMFDNYWAPYFVEAIKLRFNNSFKDIPECFIKRKDN